MLGITILGRNKYIQSNHYQIADSQFAISIASRAIILVHINFNVGHALKERSTFIEKIIEEILARRNGSAQGRQDKPVYYLPSK